MKFTKMQGLGNDYVYVNCFEETVKDPKRTAVLVSDRHFGIGADGLILIQPSDIADCRMDMYNMDGSRGAMCGNGIRCVGKYAYDHHIVDKTKISVETLSGVKHLDLKAVDGKAQAVTVDMGKKQIGPGFEMHPRFPDRTNTEFVQVIDRTRIKMRVWERGSGETMACGTGACAAAVACVLAGYTQNRVQVELLGGTLDITWDREKDTVYMTGPAVEVFSGEWDDRAD